jgi:hypothetical protein
VTITATYAFASPTLVTAIQLTATGGGGGGGPPGSPIPVGGGVDRAIKLHFSNGSVQTVFSDKGTQSLPSGTATGNWADVASVEVLVHAYGTGEGSACSAYLYETRITGSGAWAL